MSDLNLENWWQPFTNVRGFRANPRLIERAEGCFLYTPDGRDVLDITAGLWCANLGHSRREVADAVQQQLMKMDFCPPFQFGSPVTFKFAEKLVEHAPEGLNRVFFTNSGSESVETAIKIAYRYQQARGNTGKVRYVSRQRGYHGVNMAGTSLQGIPNNRNGFPVMEQVDFMADMLDIENSAFSRGLPEKGAEKADELECIIAKHGADSICAVIVEPVVGAGGMVPPPQGYLQRLREICDANDIVLIFDEVVTGYGRTGRAFGAQSLGVTPDMMTTAKAINGGTVPMGGVFMKQEIQDVIFDQAAAGMPELFHGNTYAGNPVAAAAGLAAFEIYEREGLLDRASGPIGQYWEDALHSLRDIPHLIDIRNYGLLGAITFAPQPDKYPTGVGVPVHNKCFENGLLCRAVADNMVMSPPLTISEQEIDLFIERLRRSIGEVLS